MLPTTWSKDYNFEGVQKEIYGQFENTFMMYLPRLCEHCLNPTCAAACPSGAIYKREEDGIVLIDQDKCRGWRMCVSKAYAVAASARSAAAPEIPTVDEAGLPEFYTSNWFALWAPKRTPQDVIAKLNAAAVDALADISVRKRLADLGLELIPREQQTPGALAAFHKAEIERWWPIIKEAGIKVQ